jgi:hypothetical protein
MMFDILMSDDFSYKDSHYLSYTHARGQRLTIFSHSKSGNPTKWTLADDNAKHLEKSRQALGIFTPSAWRFHAKRLTAKIGP